MLALRTSAPFRHSLKLLKWGILLVIGYFALKLVNLPDLRASMETLPAFTIPVFLGLMLLARLFYALRWKLLASSADVADLPALDLLRVGLLSEFVSIVLPSYLGGDGLRLLKLRAYTQNKRAVLASIVMDRVVGVLTLMILTAVFLPFLASYFKVELPVSAFLAGIMVVGLLLLVLALAYLLLKRSGLWLRAEALLRVTLEERSLLTGVGLSLLGHLTYVSAYVILFRHLSSVDSVSIVAIVFLALLGNSIPISLLGIEMSDGVLIVLAQMIGIAPSVTLVVIALVVASRYLFGIVGLVAEMLVDGQEIFSGLAKRNAKLTVNNPVGN
ncbi:MAG: lysylphosphatidylglycerol synthase transmembrane domain-containing protein [Chloroflexota bacterium]